MKLTYARNVKGPFAVTLVTDDDARYAEVPFQVAAFLLRPGLVGCFCQSDKPQAYGRTFVHDVFQSTFADDYLESRKKSGASI